ncbi:MAG: SGNH/GDSL hydrolase family protein [Micavibrio sp.]|nr:SGNH/GDSL hydrolase family protein [Micavibrio sp.]
MKNVRLSTTFAHAATRTLLAVTLALPLAAPLDAKAQTATPATEQRADTTTVVTWGDSIGNAIGRSLSGEFAHLINRGKDGSGLLIPNRSNSLDNVPRGAVVLMSIGTNDVGALLGAGPRTLARYAEQVMQQAEHVREQGAKPIIIGMQAPTAPYTGNPEIWNKPGFINAWIATMNGVNTAIAAAAKKHNVAYSTVSGRVTERADDHLHYTAQGSHHIAENAFRDAGIKFRR